MLAATVMFSTITIEAGSRVGLLGAAYVGVFEMGIAFILWLKALKLSSTTAKVGTLIFFSPFLSLVFIHFLVGEEIRIATIIGLLFIVIGNVLQQLAGKKTIANDR